MAKRTIEPLLWLAFSAGGVVSALVLPALVLFVAIAIPIGWVPAPTYDHMDALLGNPLSRVVVVAVVALSLFHWAHRFRYTLYDGLQIKHLNELVNTFCYGGAIVGSLIAIYLLVRL